MTTRVVTLPGINERYDQIPTLLLVEDDDKSQRVRVSEVSKLEVSFFEVPSRFIDQKGFAALRQTKVLVEATVRRYGVRSETGEPGAIKGFVWVHHVAKALPTRSKEKDSLKTVIRDALANLLGLPANRVRIPTEAFN